MFYVGHIRFAARLSVAVGHMRSVTCLSEAFHAFSQEYSVKSIGRNIVLRILWLLF